VARGKAQHRPRRSNGRIAQSAQAREVLRGDYPPAVKQQLRLGLLMGLQGLPLAGWCWGWRPGGGQILGAPHFHTGVRRHALFFTSFGDQGALPVAPAVPGSVRESQRFPRAQPDLLYDRGFQR
jgi:hypothetical protein